MAEYITEEPPEHKRDTFGLLAGVVFAAAGLSYLIGGNDVLTEHWSIFVPLVLVLLGVAGLASAAPSLRPRRPVPLAEPTSPEDDRTEVPGDADLPAE